MTASLSPISSMAALAARTDHNFLSQSCFGSVQLARTKTDQDENTTTRHVAPNYIS